MLDKFEECLYEENYQVLIISGTPTKEELLTAWDTVYVEYSQLSQNGSYNELFEILKDIDDLEAKITIANNTIKYLRFSYDEDLVKVLNSLSLRCDVLPEDTGEVLVNKLNGVTGRMKRWFPKLSQLKKDLAVLRANSADKIDRNYFGDWLDVMSEAKGYQIQNTTITVARFCRSLSKIIQRSNEEQAKAALNGSSKGR